MLSQRLTPCLWFDDQAEEAANYYVSIFKDSRIASITRYSSAGQEFHHRPPGSVMVVSFELDGHTFTALNGGAEAWRSIAEGLGRGQTIGQAVSAWNTAHPPFAYRIVGNQHARISLN